MTIANRVRETTSTVSTGTISLAGAPTGRRTFVAAFGTGNPARYLMENADGTEWEFGLGTVTAGTPDTLTRDTVIASSNSGNLVNFSAGSKNVSTTTDADLLRFGAGHVPTAGGTADARTVAHSPAINELVGGMKVAFYNGAAANATATPQLNIDGSGLKPWRRRDGAEPAIGEFAADIRHEVFYDEAEDEWRMCFDVGQQILNVISPASISTSQNDWSPTGLSGAGAIRIAASAAVNITGIAAIADTRTLWLHNISAYAITLKDESASSSAANRFALVSDLVLSPDESVALKYDATSQRWRAAGDVAAVGDGQATIVAGEDLADRDLIYQDTGNQRAGGATKWYKIDVDATGPVRMAKRVGIALAAITSGNSGLAQVRAGRVAGFTGLTAGEPVYASTTAGGVTQTVPPIPTTGTQRASRLIGIAASTTEVDFAPDETTVYSKSLDACAVDGTITVEHHADAGARERIPRAYISGDLFASTAAVALDANYNDRSTYAIRVVVPAASISTSGTKIKITLAAGSTEGLTFTTCRIAEKAAAGNAWDFATGGTTVLFSGVDGGTISAGSTLTSDETTFTLDETKNYVVSFYISGSGSFDSARKKTTLSGWTTYEKIGTSADASGTTPSSFSDSNEDVIGLAAILVGAGTRQEPVTIGSSALNASATDRVNVVYADGAGANQDTFTTFTNRLGSTQNIIAEVRA